MRVSGSSACLPPAFKVHQQHFWEVCELRLLKKKKKKKLPPSYRHSMSCSQVELLFLRCSSIAYSRLLPGCSQRSVQNVPHFISSMHRNSWSVCHLPLWGYFHTDLHMRVEGLELIWEYNLGKSQILVHTNKPEIEKQKHLNTVY